MRIILIWLRRKIRLSHYTIIIRHHAMRINHNFTYGYISKTYDKPYPFPIRGILAQIAVRVNIRFIYAPIRKKGLQFADICDMGVK